jgi:putative oxygen-independent coproporphyrinogen III oxidase
LNAIPRSLYVHIPWCLRKCPYCDFNSHEAKQPDFSGYGRALTQDLLADLNDFGKVPFRSVFFGGGTPSLMPPEDLQPLFQILNEKNLIDRSTEITLEANPGTRDRGHLAGYRDLGINRLSIGVQSFQKHTLEVLGRIHDTEDSIIMVEEARTAGFKRINLDLMHGTPGQTSQESDADLNKAKALGIDHISWYQMTIEKNTAFFSNPPILPNETTLERTELSGSRILESMGLVHYEISAFATPGEEAKHNMNYWEFGDYLGLGAGAHGKVTVSGEVLRTTRTRHPDHYLKRLNVGAQRHYVDKELLGAECLMNSLRLQQGISYSLFTERTGLDPEKFRRQHLMVADDLGLLMPEKFQATELGWRHLNRLLEMLV